MPLVTNKPGMSDENTKRYYDINQKIIDYRNEISILSKEEKDKRRKLENKIQDLLMEQVLLSREVMN